MVSFSVRWSRVVFLAGMFLFAASPIEARAAVQPGLIKGSGPVIFYLASNERRYAFPNEQTFRTWYQDFSRVRTVSDAELARYTYGGNVTYRPGTRLLKRVGDSKIYTVGRGGMLRWITSPTLARSYYGSNWLRLVDELPEPRVADYVFGEPIRATRDAAPAMERVQTPTIEQNRRVSVSVPSLPVSPAAPVAPSGPVSSRVSPPIVTPPSVVTTPRASVVPVIWPGQVRTNPAPVVTTPVSPVTTGGVNPFVSGVDLSLYPGALRAIPVTTEAALRNALQTARPGDVIAVSGSYALTSALAIEARGTVDRPIYLVARGGRSSARFTVSGDRGLLINNARYVVVDGILINRTGGHIIEIQGQSSYITLKNLTLSDAGTDGDVISIHQASYVTVENSDLARPGRRSDTTDNGWQELIDIVDASQVVIRRNWMHDFGNTAGSIRGGSEYVRIEQNFIDGQRAGSVDPVWSIGGWTDGSVLTRPIAYEAVETLFEGNVVAHGISGGLALMGANNTTIQRNLFLNTNEVLVQARAGNGSEQRTEDVRLVNNRFVDTRSRMPNVCEVQAHELRTVVVSGNRYWNNGVGIPAESDCGFVPSAESDARTENLGISDNIPVSYEAAMVVVGRT
ncbi:right-handed parallel beta-helix repeat-containing protein [Patescibacteria group bacterium]|nr:right-handed parallel beta-helix repeat-containing protein [Patescibacteria group bacterium]MBP9710124.1 right-handed parallel beta-helix repeat-containing protein [Patescibacteria group bacterium]